MSAQQTSLVDFFDQDPKEPSTKTVKKVIKKVTIKEPVKTSSKASVTTSEKTSEKTSITTSEKTLINESLQNIEKESLFGSSTKDILIVIRDLLSSIDTIKSDISKLQEQESTIDAHVSVIQKLVHERLTAEPAESTLAWVQPAVPETSSGSSSGKASKKIFIKKYDEFSMKICGKTFDQLSLIKSIPGSLWNKDEKVWTIPSDQTAVIEDKFRSNSVEFVREY
jgi:hypothetical protein